MPPSPDVFPQRRPAKLPDTLVLSCCRNPSRSSMHMQESCKGDPGHRSVLPATASRALVRYIMVLIGVVAVVSAAFIHGSGIVLERANYFGRQCFNGNLGEANYGSRKKFAIVTCTDGASRIPGRSFEGLMDLVAPNKLSYAKRHGYHFIDASDLLDEGRPPSWSKILAVRKHLPNFDWVFWNDADSLVTNLEIRLEEIIESVVGSPGEGSMPDFIVTNDVTGANAGMFFFRNSEWSIQFLDLWWNQTSFIRPYGQMKSGDNDALKYLLQHMPKEEFHQHVRIPEMQCMFNSYLWKPSLKSGHRLMALTKTVWKGVYSRGDFMVHLAGLNDKKVHMKKILQDVHQHKVQLEKTSRKEGTQQRTL